MKNATVAAMLFLAIGWSVSSTNAFVPNKFLGLCVKIGMKCIESGKKGDADMVTHRMMTEAAIVQMKDILLAEISKDDLKWTWRWTFTMAVSTIVWENSKVDLIKEKGERKLAPAHFDGEQFENGQKRLIELRELVVKNIKSGDFKQARIDTGRMFHTLQDFYSHSNWIENGYDKPYSDLGKRDKSIDSVVDKEKATCIDCKSSASGNFYECKDNIIESITKDKLLTSGYTKDSVDADGETITKPKGKCSHGGIFLDPTQDEPAKGGINKDTPYQAMSPHYYLHGEAAKVAQDATFEMLLNLRKEVDDEKFREYLGLVKSQNSAERSAGSLMRSHNRNAMLQHHWNRIEELHTESNTEDMEAIVAEIEGLMAKIERLNERQFRAEQQAQAAAERAAKKRESLKNEDTFKISDVAAAIW